MKIWLINSAEATPIDEGNIRLRRIPLLARTLLEREHEVVWWNADFFHATKKLFIVTTIKAFLPMPNGTPLLGSAQK